MMWVMPFKPYPPYSPIFGRRLLSLLNYVRLVMTILCISITACQAAQQAAPRIINVYVTVDWEGFSLEQDNLDAVMAFRKRYPQIPLWHFMNPVYWVRAGADVKAISARINPVLQPQDVIGLHLHGWKKMFDYCHIPYQAEPEFGGRDEHCTSGDCGYAVSLELAYDQTALARLFTCSAYALEHLGYGRVNSYRAGGWQLGPKSIAALHASDFVVDSSRTDAHWVEQEWKGKTRLVEFIQQLHPNASVLDQPYALTDKLKEYPDNASLADYTREDDLVQAFETVLQHHGDAFVTGFHQETAFEFLHRLEDAIPRMEAAAKAAGVTIQWRTPIELQVYCPFVGGCPK